VAGYEKSAHLYDLFDSKDNLGFFLSYAEGDGPVLDVGAGTGRISIPLAQQGTRVVCVEPSEGMRRVFERKLARRPALRDRIELVPADAVTFDLSRTFPVATVSGVFDHFLHHDERLAALRNIVNHLKPGGVLVFDVFLGMMGSTPLSPAGCVEDGVREYRRFVARDVLPGDRVEVHLVYETWEDGRLLERMEEVSLVGITCRAEIRLLLDDVGAVLVAEFSDYDRTPYREGDDLLIVEAVVNQT
jgi:SAM-dependent methyltransferase